MRPGPGQRGDLPWPLAALVALGGIAYVLRLVQRQAYGELVLQLVIGVLLVAIVVVAMSVISRSA